MIVRLIASYLRWRLRHVWADIDAAQSAIAQLGAQRAAWINDASDLQRKLQSICKGRSS